MRHGGNRSRDRPRDRHAGDTRHRHTQRWPAAPLRDRNVDEGIKPRGVHDHRQPLAALSQPCFHDARKTPITGLTHRTRAPWEQWPKATEHTQGKGRTWISASTRTQPITNCANKGARTPLQHAAQAHLYRKTSKEARSRRHTCNPFHRRGYAEPKHVNTRTSDRSQHNNRAVALPGL